MARTILLITLCLHFLQFHSNLVVIPNVFSFNDRVPLHILHLGLYLINSWREWSSSNWLPLMILEFTWGSSAPVLIFFMYSRTALCNVFISLEHFVGGLGTMSRLCILGKLSSTTFIHFLFFLWWTWWALFDYSCWLCFLWWQGKCVFLFLFLKRYIVFIKQLL